MTSPAPSALAAGTGVGDAPLGWWPSPQVLLLKHYLRACRRNPSCFPPLLLSAAQPAVLVAAGSSRDVARLVAGEGAVPAQPWLPAARRPGWGLGAGSGSGCTSGCSSGILPGVLGEERCCGGESGAGSGKRWKSRERHGPNSYRDKHRTSSTLPHAAVSRAEVLLVAIPKRLKNRQGRAWCLLRPLSECFPVCQSACWGRSAGTPASNCTGLSSGL